MNVHLMISITALALAGCTTAVTNKSAVQPCEPDRRGSETCGNAIFNATVIGQIHKGQSQEDVRGIMAHGPERVEIDGVTESWGYMTSHRNSMITWITFTDREVSSLSHESIVR